MIGSAILSLCSAANDRLSVPTCGLRDGARSRGQGWPSTGLAAAAISKAILEGGEHAVTLAAGSGRLAGAAAAPANHQPRTVLAAVEAASRRLRRWALSLVWASPDRRCARRSGVCRPGRRNGPAAEQKNRRTHPFMVRSAFRRVSNQEGSRRRHDRDRLVVRDGPSDLLTMRLLGACAFFPCSAVGPSPIPSW
jgi:hypothetical protein